jgi:hypothetical protein
LFLAEAFANTGQLKKAQDEQRRGYAFAPTELLATTQLLTTLATGDSRQIESAWQHALAQATDVLFVKMHELRNRPSEARAELRKQFSMQPRIIAASRIALWAAIFGDPRLAVQALREDKDLARRRITALALWRPVMAEARRTPEFKQLVREWDLVDYWKQYGWGDHCKPVGADDFECR